MVFSRLENLVRGMKWTLIPVLSALTISCGSCDDDNLTVDPCNYNAVEICNNYIDDNCNGILNEGCDEDNDGYCSWGKNIQYTLEKTPEVCIKTFEYCKTEPCKDLLLDCKDDPNDDSFCPTGYMDPTKDCQKEEYAKCAPCVNPGAIEICDGYDNNCNTRNDESFPEDGQPCGEGLGNNYELDGIGICRAGTYTCNIGDLVCINFQGPDSEESCNGYSDTCGLKEETALTDARECYYDTRIDQFGNNVTIELPLDHPTIGKGNCKRGVELCINGVVGGDNECHGAVLPTEEICDCIDNDCDDEVDEETNSNKKLQYGVGVDTSGSMMAIIGNIRTTHSSITLPPCFLDENVAVSTIRLGDERQTNIEPILKRSRVTVAEFRRTFTQDIPGAIGPHEEPSANTIVYTACAILEQPPHITPDICNQIHDQNTLRYNHPDNITGEPVFDQNAEKTLFVLSDEPYQWINGLARSPSIVNQQEAAELTRQAGIKVIVFTSPRNDNYEIDRQSIFQGYAYFRDVGGEVLDINTVNSAQYMEDMMKNDYCKD